MNFMEAVKAMKEGKKVKFNAATYFIESNWIYREYIGETIKALSIPVLEGTDWELGKTLSDKSINNIVCITESFFPLYKEEDVKEAIKEFIKRCEYDGKIKIMGLEPAAKEIFGERLL